MTYSFTRKSYLKELGTVWPPNALILPLDRLQLQKETAR